MGCKDLLSSIDVNSRGAQGRTPLHRALGEASIEVSKLLIEEGKADPLIVDEMKRSSMHYAALNPSDNVAIVELLFSIGKGQETMNMQSKSDSTPLHCAIDTGHIGIAKCLISHGADFEKIKDENGKTCLALAKDRKLDKELKKLASGKHK